MQRRDPALVACATIVVLGASAALVASASNPGNDPPVYSLPPVLTPALPAVPPPVGLAEPQLIPRKVEVTPDSVPEDQATRDAAASRKPAVKPPSIPEPEATGDPIPEQGPARDSSGQQPQAEPENRVDPGQAQQRSRLQDREQSREEQERAMAQALCTRWGLPRDQCDRAIERQQQQRQVGEPSSSSHPWPPHNARQDG